MSCNYLFYNDFVETLFYTGSSFSFAPTLQDDFATVIQSSLKTFSIPAALELA